MVLNSLKILGLSLGEIKVYSALLDLGNSTLNNIQEKTGIERRNIYDILNKLIEKGFVTFILEKGKKSYQCTHPNKLLDEITQRKNRLEELESQIPDITKQFKISKPSIRAEVYRGNESIKALFNEILEYNKSYWLGGNSFQEYTAVPKNLQIWFSHWMNKRIEKKHMMYDLVDHGTYLKGLEPKDKKKHIKQYYRYCQLPKDLKSPMVLIMFGDRVAQILWSEQSFAFVLESKEINKSFMKYFEYFWKDQY